jgi:hypothetical protein
MDHTIFDKWLIKHRCVSDLANTPIKSSLCTQMVYVNRVSVRHGVRSYSLISFRTCPPPRAMFRIHYSSLDRCITLGAIMLTLSIGVSFSPCKTQGQFPTNLPFPSPRWKRLALDTICLALPRRLHGCKQRREETAQQHPECVQLKSRVGICQPRSKARCKLAANWSTASPLGMTLEIL